MNSRQFLIPVLLAALTAAGCAGLGGGSDDSGTTSVASLREGGRGGPTVSDSEISSSIKDAFKQDPELAAANSSTDGSIKRSFFKGISSNS